MIWRIAIVVLLATPASSAQPHLTPIPNGPFHVEGQAIIDSSGQPFLIRGTQLPSLDIRPTGFGPHSATTLITIRQRWNMNAVRIPVSVAQYDHDASYLSRLGEIVRRANSLELLVILAATEPNSVRFWLRAAGYFKDYPNVFFAASASDVPTIRASGARQPVVVATPNIIEDRNVIYEEGPPWIHMRIDETRDAPVLASLSDLLLERDSSECTSIPNDPTAAEKMIEASLSYLDAHNVSWIASSFEPGRLITDYRYLDATRLDNGWTCGAVADAGTGMGVAVQFHLLNA
jgi:Cellulase (glycosyl hydrolase family 5)